MAASSTIRLTFNFNHPDLDAEELDQEVQRLQQELRQMEEVERVQRVVDPNPPAGNKSMSGFLVGLLLAEVNPVNLKNVFRFLGDRLGSKPIEIEVQTADGRKLVVKAHSRQELEAALQVAREFSTVTA